jgi:hypothetical protein
LYWDGNWRGGYVDAQVEITYDHTREWWVSDVGIVVHNGCCGAEAEGKTVILHPYDQLYVMVADSVRQRYETQVEEKIEAKIAEFGIAAE